MFWAEALGLEGLLLFLGGSGFGCLRLGGLRASRFDGLNPGCFFAWLNRASQASLETSGFVGVNNSPLGSFVHGRVTLGEGLGGCSLLDGGFGYFLAVAIERCFVLSNAQRFFS